ncbi:hypothetical protein ES703_117130 [subsurface metagenome]
MAEYQILTEDEQDDIKVSFLRSQEKDKYCHAINKERYTAMLSVLEDGAWKTRVEKLLAETTGRLAEVDSIIAATLPQMPTQERIDAAIVRLQAAPTS